MALRGRRALLGVGIAAHAAFAGSVPGVHNNRKTKKGGLVDNTDDSKSEPMNYIPYGLYTAEFCKKKAEDWTLDGTWSWSKKGCELKSGTGEDNMAWMGVEDPLSLVWEDYTCKLGLHFDTSGHGATVRSLVTYAQATTSSFDAVSGYECAVERTKGGDYYLRLYLKDGDERSELASKPMESSDVDGEASLLELQSYNEWKTCYFTTNGVTYHAEAEDRTFKKGSVGVTTSKADTFFTDINCFELGTFAPTFSPVPSAAPTHEPTEAPPSPGPTHTPTRHPSPEPTATPSVGPTPYPSATPTPEPTSTPTVGPTPYPSATPSPVPTVGPTPYPSATPSPAPSEVPTVGPSPYPSATPTPKPTFKPSPGPTATPSSAPTHEPTLAPTPMPSEAPTSDPTSLPTAAPSHPPSPEPSGIPTVGPTPYPSAAPTPKPTPRPTSAPSQKPTPNPTQTPTGVPTVGPTPYPSAAPTTVPSPQPSAVPSGAPTALPTYAPSEAPSKVPIPQPTPYPSALPTGAPSHTPTPWPSEAPSQEPTISLVPSMAPTINATNAVDVSNGKTEFGTADIGFTVMGVVLFMACIVCCLAGIGVNSKRKKRERENARAWDEVARSVSESGGGLDEPLNPMSSGGDPAAGDDSLWSSGLFGITQTTTTTTTTMMPVPTPYQAEGRESVSREGSRDPSIAQGEAVYAAEPAEEEAYFASMWPGSGGGAKGGAKGGKGGGKSEKEYGAAKSQEEEAYAATVEASWGDEAQVVHTDGAVVHQAAHADDEEEFHF